MFHSLNQGTIEGGIGCNHAINIMTHEAIGNLDQFLRQKIRRDLYGDRDIFLMLLLQLELLILIPESKSSSASPYCSVRSLGYSARRY